jgi:hypothetical protein
MLILPALLIIIFFVSLVKYLALVIVVTVLTWIIAKIRQSNLSFKTIMSVSIFCITIPVIFDIVLLPYLRIWWLSLLLYIILFAFCILTLSEKSFSEMKHKDLFQKGDKKKKNDDDF